MKDSSTEKDVVRAVGYVRVSTDEQSRKGYGLDVQRSAIEDYAADKGYELVEVYEDAGVSGALPPQERPALSTLLKDAEHKGFNVVIVHRVDRLSREQIYGALTLKELDMYGVKFESVQENFEDSPMGEFMFQLVSSIAELDRKNTILKMKAGKKKALRAGHWMGSGYPAFGFDYNPETKQLDPRPEDLKWVKKIYTWFDHGVAIREITRRMRASGVPTVSNRLDVEGKEDSRWSKYGIYKILKNEIYTGKKALEFDNEEYTYTTVQTISDELYVKTQDKFYERKQRSKRKRDYLFLGLVYCAKCGGSMAGSANVHTDAEGGKRVYKRYSQRTPKADLPNTSKCEYCGCVAESKLMSVWKVLKEILSNPDIMFKQIERYKKEGADDHSKEIEMIETRLKGNELERKRLVKAYVDLGGITEREYKDRLRKIEKENRELKGRQAELSNIETSLAERERAKQSVIYLHTQIKDKLDKITYKQKCQLIPMLVERIDYDVENGVAYTRFRFSSSILVEKKERNAKSPYVSTLHLCPGQDRSQHKSGSLEDLI